MNFSDYVEMTWNKTTNKKVVIDTPLPDSPKDAYSFLKSIDKSVWTAKIINDEKFLFFNDHYLNVSELKKEIRKLYKAKGYEHYGFDKLSESELIRYKTIKDFLIKQFYRNDVDELDPAETAEIIFNHEIKNFEWKPEELTL